ncbi:hypothetical protein EYR41_002025 [Orbilia oligospora]|uniref:Uncharacterized protein n=1 Tax=Orbilia oligospora TaxID=2813651 RepID=A0A7C8PBP1_ORBOL|nr:hypothetical protein TWF751_011311 [Orbilia oligospora]KAF3296990.1 hypothetical protein TWF132_008363 [Orbilia oligospora]TGJ75077.1 hypothetical protein EYR41_002025 [Orbilia oligospora]
MHALTDNSLRTIDDSRPIENGLYPHPLDTFSRPLLYREQCLRKFSAKFREEKDWTHKLTDRTFVANKMREAAAVDCALLGEKIQIWSKEDVELIYKELTEGYKPYVEKWKQTKLQPDIDGVWRIDDFVDESLRQELIKAAAILEADPEKPWHSVAGRQLLDLVHPCDFPIVYGHSKTMDGEPVEAPKFRELTHGNSTDYYAPEYHYSEKFCWLPSEFEISKTGETKIASYINNLALDEEKTLFYPILEKIFSKFIPLFNHALADLRREAHELRRVEYQEYREQQKSISGKSVTEDVYKKTRDRLFRQFEKGEKLTADVIIEPETPNLFKRFVPFHKRTEVLFGGNPPSFVWEPPPESLLRSIQLQGTTVKVIVKMATLILTPEKPRTTGGPWHVEALKNERIVAGGIYYYDQRNITPSSLGFRRAVRDMTLCMEGECQGLSGKYNSRNHIYSRAAQEMGSIATKNNRAIVFPNIYQHRTEPLELIDKTKNGYRRILAFFLCDPSGLHEIPTTRTVPPQQPGVRKAAMKKLRDSGDLDLPFMMLETITKDLPSTISKEDNERYRRELMEERTKLNGNTRV